MSYEELLEIAMKQSAVDSNCNANDFKLRENRIVLSEKNPNARRYLELPFICDLTSYGNNIVASVTEDLREIVKSYLAKYPIEHCFETPNLHKLMDELSPKGINVCFMAEYFLPDLTETKNLTIKYEVKVLEKEDFADCYLPKWSNALCETRKQYDQLAVGAYDKGKLIGLAGCSADCDTMWQIGIDVLEEYRNQDIAACLTNKLAHEVLKRNIVPFYCCAWSNIKSVRNALKSGFKPAWVQITVKTKEFIEKLNE